MINFSESNVADILPESVRKDPMVMALGYAVNKQVLKIIDQSKRISMYGAIDELPDKILDLLAIEMRAQYYNSNLPLNTKRDILKKTLVWHYYAGTLSAVRELVEFVWGSNIKIEEWFQFEGDPYTFQIELFDLDNIMDDQTIADFIEALWKVKNTRSWLKTIIFHRQIIQKLFSGAVATPQYSRQVIVDFYNETYKDTFDTYTGFANAQVTRQNIKEV
ncbi:phage tail protein I [Eisenbergiella tayi]|uniref:phage tail protein I n=1 Tax=Eisenbergiella tayi TaxID=1432052 RepID=UPI0008495120|nr:phage tail protein I [Eisenbergiella tayi]ODR35508.1 phage tail protein I [Eisenbergiella tayi]